MRVGCARTFGARSGGKTYCGSLDLRDTKEIRTWEIGVWM